MTRRGLIVCDKGPISLRAWSSALRLPPTVRRWLSLVLRPAPATRPYSSETLPPGRHVWNALAASSPAPRRNLPGIAAVWQTPRSSRTHSRLSPYSRLFIRFSALRSGQDTGTNK